MADSKNNTLEQAWLNLFFNGTSITGIATNDAATTTISIALHTADPGETGTQATNETTYPGYVRKTVARTSGGWTVSLVGNVASVKPVADITFATSTGSSAAITHASVAIGNNMYYGILNSPITVVTGTIPVILAGSTITEE